MHVQENMSIIFFRTQEQTNLAREILSRKITRLCGSDRS